MKTAVLGLAIIGSCSIGWSQVQVDRAIELTGSGANARVTGIDSVGFSDDAVNVSTLQSGRLVYAESTGSGGAYAVQMDPPVLSLNPGAVIHFKANHSTTGAASLDVNGLGAVAIKKGVSQDLISGDILNGQVVTVIYDGTNFQYVNPENSVPCSAAGAAGTISGPATFTVSSGGYNYSVSPVANATDYAWDLPFGAYITAGQNTNSITVAYASSAVSGTISVHAYNGCSNGAKSPLKSVVLTSPKNVFVSSVTQSSTTSVASRDQQCQTDASNAGLTGTYKAWMANGANNNVSSTTNFYYRLVDNTVVAADWSDLTDGTLLAPINLTASGSSVSENVWTGVDANGSTTANTCSSWSSTGANGTYGSTGSAGSGWTNAGSTSCGTSVQNTVGYVFDGCPCTLFDPAASSCGTVTGYTTLVGRDGGGCNLNSNGHNGWIICCVNAVTTVNYRHYCFQQ